MDKHHSSNPHRSCGHSPAERHPQSRAVTQHGDEGEHMNYIAFKDNEGNYKVILGKFIGVAKTETDATELVKADIGKQFLPVLERDFIAANMDFPPNFENGPNVQGTDY